MAETVMVASPEHIRYLADRGFIYATAFGEYAAFWEAYRTGSTCRGLALHDAGWQPVIVGGRGRSSGLILSAADWRPGVWFNDPVTAYAWAEVQGWTS